MPTVIRYLDGGGIRKIHEPDDVPRGTRPIRASRVEPLNPVFRYIFLAIRKTFGDEGRMAACTRTWSCTWRVRLFLKPWPILGPFATRDAALAAEKRWILDNWVLAEEIL